MIKSFVFLTIFFFVIHSYSSLTCRYESNVEYVGSLIGGASYVTAGECCRMCTNEPLCLAWNYDRRTYTCYLRGTFLYRRYRCGILSGPRGCNDVLPPHVTETTVKPLSTTPMTGTTTTKAAGCLIDFEANYPGNDIGGSYNVESVDDCCLWTTRTRTMTMSSRCLFRLVYF